VQFFPKQTTIQTLIGLSLQEKLDTPVSKIGQSSFYGFGFWLGFLLSWLLDTFYSFSMPQNTIDLQIFEFSSFLDFILKLQKLDGPK
jgi:hypothetical protein